MRWWSRFFLLLRLYVAPFDNDRVLSIDYVSSIQLKWGCCPSPSWGPLVILPSFSFILIIKLFTRAVLQSWSRVIALLDHLFTHHPPLWPFTPLSMLSRRAEDQGQSTHNYLVFGHHHHSANHSAIGSTIEIIRTRRPKSVCTTRSSFRFNAM